MANSPKKVQNSIPSSVLIDPVYSSMITILILLMACVEICDAVTVVDVYRLVQYDLGGVPFGSRLASLNHHASSSLFSSSSGAAADLSRTVLILPVRELNLTFIKEYIAQKKPLGGLLLLRPAFSPISDSVGGSDQDSAKDLMKEVLVELEQLLIHANIPYPVYFGFDDDSINTVLADVQEERCYWSIGNCHYWRVQACSFCARTQESCISNHCKYSGSSLTYHISIGIDTFQPYVNHHL
ncbi:Transcription factor TCP14 [Olea europaea subsp. europaea]|uniref:Transcription factor TCP14 n=1 Tax=Olea europaea subsp. europaea TaxID=158383 RepID=A0A8S0RPV9_OLEEU|nr:Transcription factor TCP14 [Olea europaea subsp. europaea]